MSTGDRRSAPGSLVLVCLLVAPPALASQSEADLSSLDNPVRLEARLRELSGAPNLTVPGGRVVRGDLTIPEGATLTGHRLVLDGSAMVRGTLEGNLVVLDGDLILEPSGVVTGEALVIGGRVRERGGVVHGELRSLDRSVAAAQPRLAARIVTRLAGLVGIVGSLTLLGFGMVMFAHPQLETVSETVSHSMMRSLLTGLVAQVLILPTVAILVTGLVLSIVGILVVPFVILIAGLLILAGTLGGFLAVTHAMGETRLRRRMAAGERVGSPNSYRYILLGMTGFGALWLAWVLVGWVPVAGTLVLVAAGLATWLLATVGLGAAVLSRGGVQPVFAGRYLPQEALTDEYLWATPRYGVDAVKRPKQREP